MKLKACPFCGSKPKYYTFGRWSSYKYKYNDNRTKLEVCDFQSGSNHCIECLNCHTNKFGKSLAEVVKKWNKRKRGRTTIQAGGRRE